MHRRVAALLCLIVISLSLGGCSKCGWLGLDGGRACHAETPR